MERLLPGLSRLSGKSRSCKACCDRRWHEIPGSPWPRCVVGSRFRRWISASSRSACLRRSGRISNRILREDFGGCSAASSDMRPPATLPGENSAGPRPITATAKRSGTGRSLRHVRRCPEGCRYTARGRCPQRAYRGNGGRASRERPVCRQRVRPDSLGPFPVPAQVFRSSAAPDMSPNPPCWLSSGTCPRSTSSHRTKHSGTSRPARSSSRYPGR